MSAKLLQEALSVKDYYEAGWSREEIAADTGKSPTWVQVRCMILDLDIEVKKMFMEENFLVSEVRRLYSLKENILEQRTLATKFLAQKVAKATVKGGTPCQ